MFVDKLSAPLVTVSNCKLDEILVLHLVDGKDFFVSFSKKSRMFFDFRSAGRNL